MTQEKHLTFKAALFDLDGTLIDTEGQYSVIWGRISAKYRPDLPDMVNMIKGTTLKQIFENYITNPEDQVKAKAELDEGEANMHYDWVPGALEFIKDVRARGVKCALVTSSNQLKMASVRRYIANFDNLFDKILTAEDFAASKPNPDCYLRAAAAFGLGINECVVFEDALNGLQAGVNAKMFTIGLATTNPAEKIADKCDYVIKDFIGFNYEKVTQIINEK